MNDNELKTEIKTRSNKAAEWIGSVLKETLDNPKGKRIIGFGIMGAVCLLYTSPSPRD